MTDASTLLVDQVFQLNTFLWALEDIPEKGQIQPVLGSAGYYLGAIGRQLLMPSAEQSVAALAKLTGSTDRTPCRPDLWLRHESDAVQPLVELKAHGFSAESSNRRQALKLIAAAVDLSSSLAEPAETPGHVLYATVATDASEMASTLQDLARALRAAGVAAAPTGAIGLAIEANGVVLSSPNVDELPEPLAGALESRPVVLHDDGKNDLQPLYFVPWIPGNDNSQHPDLHAAGLRELTARVLTQMLAEIGRARPPTTLQLDGTRLLRAATLGVFDQWRDADRRQFSEAVAAIVDKSLGSVVTVRRTAPDSREIDVPNGDVKETLVERLELADPADPAVNLQAAVEEPPRLFDDL